jgi:hypothetical protein
LEHPHIAYCPVRFEGYFYNKHPHIGHRAWD